MDLDNLTYPDGVEKPTESQEETFEEWVWYNAEICNNCFSQVRAVGDVIHIESQNGLFTFDINDYYERTDSGSQEFDPYSTPADRFGTCYCLECGADTNAEDRTLSLDEHQTRLKAISKYLLSESPYTVDLWAVGKSLARLRQVDDNHGFDTEILCTALCAGLES